MIRKITVGSLACWIEEYLTRKGHENLWDINLTEIEEGINAYLRSFLWKKNESTTNLLNELSHELKAETKDQEMSSFVFYILSYMSSIQEFGITWEIEENTEPYLKESKYYPGKIDALVTAMNYDLVKVYNFVLEEARKMSNTEERSR